jgi:hypothetical protein
MEIGLKRAEKRPYCAGKRAPSPCERVLGECAPTPCECAQGERSPMPGKRVHSGSLDPTGALVILNWNSKSPS